MPSIDIRRRHDLTPDAAKALVEDIAVRVCAKYGLRREWRGNVLHFRRGGVDGLIDIGSATIHIRAELGLMLGMLKTAIHNEIERELDAHLA